MSRVGSERFSKPDVAAIYFEPHKGELPEVWCSCGWRKRHGRAKVLAKAASKHMSKTGHKWAKKNWSTL